MKRRICTIAAVLVLILTMVASAVEPRIDYPRPSLSFSGTTANCKINVSADSPMDSVSVTVELWHGSTRLKTWTQTGTGQVLFSKTHSNGIEKGEEYTMTVSYSIAGKTYPAIETSATCRG